MSQVFVNIGLSLDGYMAPEGMTVENWDKSEYKNWQFIFALESEQKFCYTRLRWDLNSPTSSSFWARVRAMKLPAKPAP